MGQHKALLGGGFAAVCYSNRAKPKIASLYLDDQNQWDLLREMQFIKTTKARENNSHGVHVYSKFWVHCEQQNGSHNVTHPLITYADILETNNPCNHAAANDIAVRYFAD
ncbi:MAG: hypothetical protein ACI9FR_002289 [Cryomorphaceae bacterium]